MPFLLLQVAQLLNEGHDLWRINVEKEGGDRLKGTIAHSKAKKKEYKVFVRKDKDILQISAGTNNPNAEECPPTTTSGQKRQEKGPATKPLSSAKTVKMSKNQKRKERPIQHASSSSSFPVYPSSDHSPFGFNEEAKSPLGDFSPLPMMQKQGTASETSSSAKRRMARQRSEMPP